MRSVGLVWLALFPGDSFSLVKSMSVIGLPTKRRRASFAALGVVKNEVHEERGEQPVSPAIQQPYECHVCLRNLTVDTHRCRRFSRHTTSYWYNEVDIAQCSVLAGSQMGVLLQQ